MVCEELETVHQFVSAEIFGCRPRYVSRGCALGFLRFKRDHGGAVGVGVQLALIAAEPFVVGFFAVGWIVSLSLAGGQDQACPTPRVKGPLSCLPALFLAPDMVTRSWPTPGQITR